MYDFEWHKDHGEKTTTSAERIIDLLAPVLSMDAVLDVGCGDGRWLAAFWARGATTILGVDGPWTDMTRLLIPADQVAIHDLTQPFDLGRRFDMALSLEVAEHVDKTCSEAFVDNLVRHADVVLFGAAIPFQGGFRHVNEKWQSYWANLFDARGYATYDILRHRTWNDDGVHFWYKQNALLYVNRTNIAATDRVSRHIAEQNIQQLPLDIVSPEKYAVLASYRQVAFKPLIKELPLRMAEKAVQLMRERMKSVSSTRSG